MRTRILPVIAITAALALAGCGGDDGSDDTPKAAELCATYCGDFTTLERQTCIGAVMSCGEYLENKVAVVNRVNDDLLYVEDVDTASARREVAAFRQSMDRFNADCSPVPDSSIEGATCAIRGATVEANFRSLHQELEALPNG